MLEQPDSPTASQTEQQVFDHYLHRLQNEIHTIISSKAEYEERVKLLQNELEVFKRQYFTSEHARRILEDENRKLKERNAVLEGSPKNYEQRIMCLIDANGSRFPGKLLALRQNGGRQVARQLCESVQYHLQTSSFPRSIWAFVFYSKRAMLDASHERDTAELSETIDQFVKGFNQFSDRFTMVDVGDTSQAVESKTSVFLDHYTRSLQTFKLVFGACHSRGYAAVLQSLISSGHLEKIILLPGAGEIPQEIRDLPLPSLVIPNLFETEKSSSRALEESEQAIESELGPPPGLSPKKSYPASDSTSPMSSPPATPPADDHEYAPTSHASYQGLGYDTASYRTVLQKAPQSTNIKSPVRTKGGLETSAVTRKPRRINPNIPLNHHDPPPCTLFYLAFNGCKFGSECRYGHDYELEGDDYDILRRNARKWPCPALNRGELCLFGDDCCYGHKCPLSSKCPFLKQGKCKFLAASMHED